MQWFRSFRKRSTGAPAADGGERDEAHRLVELLHLPGVRAAFDAGPPLWRQVSHLEDELGAVPWQELTEYVWLENLDGWEIGLGDETFPYLELDLPEDADPIVRVLLEHPAVTDAYHEDREVYRLVQDRPIGVEELAALAARALVAHHVEVAARA